MAQRDSARQKESIGTILLLNGGGLTPSQHVFVRGGSVVPSRGVPGDFRAGVLALCFLTPPPPWLVRDKIPAARRPTQTRKCS